MVALDEVRPSRAASRPEVQRWLNAGQAAEVHHVSRIVYAVPAERVRALVPAAFDLETRHSEGRDTAFISIESFLDYGEGSPLQMFDRRGTRGGFEQTNYRVHARLNGEACGWLLGTSLGSLSAVAARHLWPAPWHLSAMEFQVAYDPLDGRYQQYRLRTQSQWANAFWEIHDTGTPAEVGLLTTARPGGTHADYFVRRDGVRGVYRVKLQPAFSTRGEVKQARCDLFERLGLLTADEMRRPHHVTLSHRLTRVIDAAPKAEQGGGKGE